MDYSRNLRRNSSEGFSEKFPKEILEKSLVGITDETLEGFLEILRDGFQKKHSGGIARGNPRGIPGEILGGISLNISEEISGKPPKEKIRMVSEETLMLLDQDPSRWVKNFMDKYSKGFLEKSLEVF